MDSWHTVNLNGASAVSVLHNPANLTKSMRSRIESISIFWLTCWMLSLTGAGCLNPSSFTAPFYVYVMVLMSAYAFAPRRVHRVFNKTTLALTSGYSCLLVVAGYVWQFEDVQALGVGGAHLGLVYFEDARRTGHMFEYFHVAALLSLYLLSASKILSWHVTEQGEEVRIKFGGR